MAQLNRPNRFTQTTYEGAPAIRMTDEQALRQSVLACLLWEDSFYESGEKIADRIARLASSVPPNVVADLAVEARERFNLRHVPLLLGATLARNHRGPLVGNTITKIIQRADEITEFLATYCYVNKISPNMTPSQLKPRLSNQVRKGVAAAFPKFDAYQLAKYNRQNALTLKDALFLCHPKPRNEEQDAMWKQLIDGTLPSPDTWEVNLSGGADKKETFTRLIQENRLGYLALIRNLRNMADSGVDEALVRQAILDRRGAQRVLPFRYLMASRAAPRFERELDQALLAAIEDLPEFPGQTIVLVDVSGSMDGPISGRSQVYRRDAAAILGALVKGDVRCFIFASGVQEVSHRLGIAGVDAMRNDGKIGHGTEIGRAVRFAEGKYPNADRIIVVTDMQSRDNVSEPKAPNAYMVNVAAYENGVGYGRWTHIDGFSENILRYIKEAEGLGGDNGLSEDPM